ncbi:MAG: amidohydrolase [Treponema sp.]|jgi:predicted amidohydrolase YtcJ|nr:amidohydrolase [Treponema sp.]
MTDTVIHNAKVYLERGRFAEAVLVRGDKIAAVGANADVLAKASGAEKIDAGGQLLLPGFNDSHLHFQAFGSNIHRIQAYDVTSIDELVERGRELIARIKAPAGSVIVGGGWNENLFTDEKDKRHPNRFDMDRISTEHAVLIDRVCGHSLCCNSLALKMAGITRNTPQVDGGKMDVDDNGEPLGIFRENAMYDIRTIVPPFTDEDYEEQLLFSVRWALERGLTSASTCDLLEDNYQNLIDTYIKIFTKHGLHIRLNMQCRIEGGTTLDDFIKAGWVTKVPMGHPYLIMGPLKLFADGSLGSRTAFLRKPYNDDPSTTGLQVLTREEMDGLVQKAHKNGVQVAIHAIGDAGIEQALDSFEKVTGGKKNELRHAVIHCQITDLPLLQRIAKSDILAIVQPIFLAHDLYMLDDRVGKELASTSYAWATMEKLGIKTSYGTDCPVESMSPIDCIDCAVNRHDVSNGYPEGGKYPAECVDVYTAVDAYTSGSAYATFEENRKGRIKQDYLADLVLLDKDIFTIPKKEIRDAKVLWTMVGGNMAYKRE